MKITTSHHNSKDVELVETLNFTLIDTNKFSIEFDNGDIEHYTVNFDLTNPDDGEKLFDKIFTSRVGDTTVEVIELHCDKDNKTHVWPLYTTKEGNPFLLTASKFVSKKYSKNTSNGITTYYNDILEITLCMYKYI